MNLKTVSKIGAVLLATGLMFTLAACGGDDDPPTPSHEHTFAAGWTSTATSHYHAATCEHTTERKDEANHNFVNGACTVCKYPDPNYDPTTEYTVNITTELDGFSYEGVKASIYGLDLDSETTKFKLVEEKEVTEAGSLTFTLDTNYYIATLSGVSEEYSFPAVLLFGETTTANIDITESARERGLEEEHYMFEFTVFVFEDGNLSQKAVNGQICGLGDVSACHPFVTEYDTEDPEWNLFPESRQWVNGIGRHQVCVGEWDIQLFENDEEDNSVETHFEYFTVTAATRFQVVIPNGGRGE